MNSDAKWISVCFGSIMLAVALMVAFVETTKVRCIEQRGEWSNSSCTFVSANGKEG